MHHLLQNLKTGALDLKEVPIPACKSGGLFVRTASSLISIGTERSIIALARRSLVGKAQARPDLLKRAIEKAQKEGYYKVFKESMNRPDEPFPLGYSAAGTVLEVGSAVPDFSPGDRVAISGAGFANHAEYNYIPRNLCVPIPGTLSFEEAAFGMVGAIALQGVREGEITFGERVAVIGLGLIGLITMQILESVGCVPIGIDLDPSKVAAAHNLGSTHSINSAEQDPMEYVLGLTEGLGADCVLITAATKENGPIELAQKITRPRGRIVLVGVSAINLDRKYFFDKEISFRVSRAAGPGLLDENYELRGIDYPIGHVRWPERRNIEYFLQLVAAGKVKVKEMITHRFPFAEAVSAYEKLISGEVKGLAVVFTYPEPEAAFDRGALDVVVKSERVVSPEKRMNTGFIGCGMFTKNVLLPVLREVKEVNLLGMATTQGMTAEHGASKFGFSYCTTDHRKVLDDASVGSVFITTRHDLHGKMVVEALKAGKHVFVEKPLCLDEEELKEIVEAYNGCSQPLSLMVGFNRRFSPHGEDIKKFFAGSKEPFVINCRINAGFIDSAHWTQDSDVGGGRIIGEVCHFVDFVQCITGSAPVRVYTESISGSEKFAVDDNIISTIKCANGSIATITYTSKGNKSYPREIFEIFQGDSVYYLEDFRAAVKVRAGKKEKKNLMGQDMGYRGELEHFFRGEITKDEVEGYLLNARTVFAMARSLKTGAPVSL